MNNLSISRLIVVLVILGAAVAAAQDDGTAGAKIYAERCAYCHGATGQGDGPPSELMRVKPRDFTDGVYKFTSTEYESIPTDGDLVRTITRGLPGTSMPAYGGVLSEDDIRAVASHLKSFSPRFASEKARPISVPRRGRYPESAVANGSTLYTKLGCETCHGEGGDIRKAVLTGLEDEWGHEIVVPSLSEPWTFRGGSAVDDIYLRIRAGIAGTPMPSFKGAVSDADLHDVAQYVASLARTPAWDMSESELRLLYASEKEHAKQKPEEWGKYLVSAFGCADCHTPLRDDGSMMSEYWLAGGQTWTLEPFFTYMYPPNLTPDTETGLGRYSDEQIKDALTKGIRPRDGSRMLPFPMPWPNYAGLSDDDLNAIIVYLRSLPPVYNKVPEHEEPNIFSYLGMKFNALILGKVYPAKIMSGNAGTPKEASLSQAASSGKGVRK